MACLAQHPAPHHAPKKMPVNKAIINTTTPFFQMLSQPPITFSSRTFSANHSMPVFITVTGFYFPDHIPSSCLLVSFQTLSRQASGSSHNSTQLLALQSSDTTALCAIQAQPSSSAMCRLSEEDRSCHPCPTPCHHLPSPLVTRVLPWHLHLRHNLSLLNFHSPVQRSSNMDLTMAMQQVWSPPPRLRTLPPCLAGQQILNATTDIRNPAPGSAQNTLTMATSPPLPCRSSSLSTIITLLFTKSEREKMKENSHRKE